MRWEQSGSGYANSVTWGYDDNNNLSTQKQTLNGTTYTTNYAYDKDNRLTKTTEGTVSAGYTYDALGRMTAMDAQSGGKSVVKTTIGYNDPSSTTATGQVRTWKSGATTYTYAYDSFDQLVRENNQAAGKTWTYAYDDDGKRITKTVNGTTYNYHYLGDQLVELTWSGNKLHFTYDSTGPLSVNCNGAEYFYVKNAQGDVTGLVTTSGTRVVTYTYDAWGNLLSTTGTMASTLGSANPLRYRGYVYDTETGLYYLQSRYYNPGWGRFINADNQVSAGSDLIGMNLFAYCENSPCNYADPTGHFLSAIIASVAAKIAAAIVAAVVSVAITVVVRPLLKKAAQEVTNAAAKMYETAKNAVMTAIEKVRSQSKEATRDTTEEKVAPLERPKFCYWEAM